VSYADHKAGLGQFPVLPLFSLNHMKKQMASEADLQTPEN
jgi:hypothetical protein